MKSTLNQKLPAMQRRTALRLAAGGSLGLVLAACGGGGGDSSSDKAQALRDAFSKLQAGMTNAQVQELVGFPANDWRTGTDLRWIEGGVTLYVGFFSTEDRIYDAKLTETDGVTTQRRDFT